MGLAHGRAFLLLHRTFHPLRSCLPFPGSCLPSPWSCLPPYCVAPSSHPSGACLISNLTPPGRHDQHPSYLTSEPIRDVDCRVRQTFLRATRQSISRTGSPGRSDSTNQAKQEGTTDQLRCVSKARPTLSTQEGATELTKPSGKARPQTILRKARPTHNTYDWRRHDRR